MEPQLELRLPDGSIRQVASGTTVREVAASIGEGLAKAAVAGEIEGDVVEVSRPIEVGGAFRILTARDEDALHVLRHSAAHLLAMAVLDLFPGTDLGFGPATEDGFYYDFKTPRPIVEDDLPKIEKRMKEIVKEGRPFERVGFDGAVKIRLTGDAIVGSGQNVSEQGVFFLTEGSIPVSVEIEGRDGTLPGELVRIENMGAGMVGIAVKFDDPHADLVDG